MTDIRDLVDRDVIGRECEGRHIALYRIGERYFATDDICTHARACLSRGEVVDGHIECPVHFGLFDIATGKAAGAPVSVDLRTYPVRIIADRIEIRMETESSS